MFLIPARQAVEQKLRPEDGSDAGCVGVTLLSGIADYCRSEVGIAAAEFEHATERAKAQLWERLSRLPIVAASYRAGSGQEVPLATVFTALDVTATVWEAKWTAAELRRAKEDGVARAVGFGTQLTVDDDYLRRLNGVEAEDAEPAPEQLACPHGVVLPVFVELRHFVAGWTWRPPREVGRRLGVGRSDRRGNVSYVAKRAVRRAARVIRRSDS